MFIRCRGSVDNQAFRRACGRGHREGRHPAIHQQRGERPTGGAHPNPHHHVLHPKSPPRRSMGIPAAVLRRDRDRKYHTTTLSSDQEDGGAASRTANTIDHVHVQQPTDWQPKFFADSTHHPLNFKSDPVIMPLPAMRTVRTQHNARCNVWPPAAAADGTLG